MCDADMPEFNVRSVYFVVGSVDKYPLNRDFRFTYYSLSGSDSPQISVMACNPPELDNLKELLTCPVCFNTFNNPRHLCCGHQFCEECLRSIADRHVDGDVICPTCRALTVVHGDVTSLPRAVLTSQIQETVEYLPHKEKPAEKPKLDLSCEEVKCSEVATKRCMKCGRNACDKCINKHERLKHKTVNIQEESFCRTHIKDVVTFYCEDCKVGVCEFCLLEDHEGHHTEDIENKAEEVRGKLQNVIKDVESIDREYQTIISNIRANIVEIARDEKNFQKNVQEYLKPLREAVNIIENTSDDYLDRTKTNKMKLTDLLTQNADIKILKRHLIDSSNKLIENENETVILLKNGEALHKQYVETENFHDICTADKRDTKRSIHAIQKIAAQCASVLQSNNDSCDIAAGMADCKEVKPKLSYRKFCTEYNTKVSMVTVSQQTEGNTSPVRKQHLQIHTVTKVKEVDMGIYGLLIDKQTQRIVARTGSQNEDPLVTFDYLGNEVSTMGNGVVLGDSTARSLSLDTKRGLYLLPTTDKIYRVDRSGQETDNILIRGNVSLRCVTYLSVEDLYVVTDNNNHKVIILDPNTKQEVRSFHGNGSDTFDHPLSITSYLDKVHNKSLIVVCDTYNNRVVEMDLHGQFIRQYGKKGNMTKRFHLPRSACVDVKHDRVFVCDRYNHRIMSCLHASNGEVQKTCLLTKEQLGGDQPFNIDYDSDSGLLVVNTFKYNSSDKKCHNGKIHIYFLPVPSP